MLISPSIALRIELLPDPVGPTITASSPFSISIFKKEIVSFDIATLVLVRRISATSVRTPRAALIASTSIDSSSDESPSELSELCMSYAVKGTTWLESGASSVVKGIT